jgi:hypothetical protein
MNSSNLLDSEGEGHTLKMTEKRAHWGLGSDHSAISVLALDYLPLGLAYVKKNNVAILGHMQPKT